MTHRIYYHDPYQSSFEATVVACEPDDRGFAVILDNTAFYPSSGGQPFDTGKLGEAAVFDVIDRDDGEIVHVVDRSVVVGARVQGRIDWHRRFDHMQQHTGQHVLSAAFDRLFGVHTESFHLGTTSATIDLAREVSAQEISTVEIEANRVVWEDRAVTIRFASEDDARTLRLRKESVRSGLVRLIEVADFDLSACGGTHVGRTGAIGIILLASWERFRGGSRLEFLCGGRARARFNEWRDALAATRQLLSVAPADLAAAVEKLQFESKSLQKHLRTQLEALAAHEARALVSRAQRVGDRRIVVDALEGWDAAGLKLLAAAAANEAPDTAIALFSRSAPPVAVIAAGAASGIDASAAMKALTASFGGKGGGKREMAQGGGFGAPVEELLAAARAHLVK